MRYYNIFLLFSCSVTIIMMSAIEKLSYVGLERPIITYVNQKYLAYVNVTSRRHSRSDPMYYLNINFEAKTWFGNNVTINFYFYELLSNRYKRGFIEVHFKLCDFVHKDTFIGIALKNSDLNRPCPYPKGPYHLLNLIFPSIPKGFPFSKGRIYMNLTVQEMHSTVWENLATGYVDMELREMKRKIGE